MTQPQTNPWHHGEDALEIKDTNAKTIIQLTHLSRMEFPIIRSLWDTPSIV